MNIEDFWPPVAPDDRVLTPKKHRHEWRQESVVTYCRDGLPYKATPFWKCARCPAIRDETRARRGKTSRNRGNAFEREVAAKLGGRRVGQYGDKVDVQVDGWLRVQCKNGNAYPERLDGWLRAIPAQADMLRAVVLGDAPGSAGKRRSLVVLDLDEFASWYASKETP